MASSQSSSKYSYLPKDRKGAEEGRVYEKLSLALLAKNGYELSKNNSKFREFAIGHEVGLGTENKFDDIVFRYTDDANAKNLIFVQIKQKQDDHQINSKALSAEAATAKGGEHGGMQRDFNLQKYFISYLRVREDLNKKNLSEELRNGNIKFVAIFTNVGLDTNELISSGFSLKEAPEDITKLFTLRTQEPKYCYQLSKISEDLRKILLKSSDLYRVARELAQYVVWKNHRERKIMGIDKSPIKEYHIPLAREVIQKSDPIDKKSFIKQTKQDVYCEAQFREEFLENDDTGSKQLRDAVFEAIRGLDEYKKSFSDDELKNFLKGIKWKIAPNFGKSKKSKEINLAREWKAVKEEDITDFLKCLVFLVNRPRINELQTLFLSSVQDAVMDKYYGISLREIVHKLENIGPELRELIENDLGIYKTTNFKEKWTFGEDIVELLDKQKQQISVSFFVTAITLIYESEVMQFGTFNESGKIETCIDTFFSNCANILCIKTPQTLLSSIKILKYLNSKKNYVAEDGRIYTTLDNLKSKENRDSVGSAFELERNVLLIIEYRHTVSEQDEEELYKKLHSVVNTKPNKKIILIMSQDEHNNLLENFKNDFENKGNFMLEHDVIDIKNFVPREDPFKKEVIIFQGQDKATSLSNITGINNWNSYLDSLSEGKNEQSLIDEMTLFEILNNEKIEVGSKPPGTSSLEGAYAKMFDEINVDTLANKLMSQEHNNDTNDMYIISGISGSSKQDKTYKLIQYLGKGNENEEFKNRLEEFKSRFKTVSVNNLKFVDDQFKESNLKELSHIYPKKRIFWISVKWKNNGIKFILQEIYNPKFYLKRKFKNVVIKKDLKENLIKANLSEIFIFHCAESKKELYNSMKLNKREIEQFENSCMIRIVSQKNDAEAHFELSKQKRTVHLLEFKENQLFWHDSYGSVESLQKYIDQKQSEIFLVEEDNLIRKIKDKKVVIFADDPGMGKTTTLIKLYEKESESFSIINCNWVIRIQLRDNLKTIRDLEFKKDSIDIISVVEFLSKIDLKLNNNLAKNLLLNTLDKNKHFPKSLVLAFDGFDEILDEKDRDRILMLLKFIKNKTTAKLWITTRLHFKKSLEKELSTFSIVFLPMDDQQKSEYIKTYLQYRLYLTLNEKIVNGLLSCSNEKQEIKSILMYTKAFLNKMKETFEGDISRFIGTPLQLQLMLEGSTAHFKKWIENDDGKIPVFSYVGHNIYEVYENFIDRKYYVYFEKVGIPEGIQRRQENSFLDQYHKHFAKFQILALARTESFDEFKDKFLLAGIIKSDVNDMQFIHKTFEEFFVAKVFFHWIKKKPNYLSNTHKQEHMLKVILMKSDYRLVRTFINLQLQKLAEQAGERKGLNELDENLKHYGDIAAKLPSEEESPLNDGTGTPLHVAVVEGNKDIACFLLNSLKTHSNALREFLFSAGEYRIGRYEKLKGTALHLACVRDDFEIVSVLLDSAEEISEDTLQELLKCLDGLGDSALVVAAENSHNCKIFNELLSRSNNKLDIILTRIGALSISCVHKKEEFVDILLQKFEHEKHSLKQLLLYKGIVGNVLNYARSTSTIQKLVSAAKSIEDNNKTLKNLLLPEGGNMPLNSAVLNGKMDIVQKLLSVGKEIDDDNHTLKQLLLNARCKKSALHFATERGYSDIIKLLLQTAAYLGIDTVEKLITAVDEKGKNAIQLMFENDHETIFADSFKMLEQNKYQTIRKKVMGMFENVPLENRLYLDVAKMFRAIIRGDIKEVKYILNNVKNSSVSPNQNLRILLLDENIWGISTLHMACKRNTLKIRKELLSYAMYMDDGGATLKELLTKSCSKFGEHKYEIETIVESLITENENSNKMHAVNILKEVKEQFT